MRISMVQMLFILLVLALTRAATSAQKSVVAQEKVGAPWALLQEPATKPLKRAYVTLLYSNFVAGTRALGRSLLDSGTDADLVVLVTPDVVQSTRTILEKDGWRLVD
jgi:hypothetical protein